MLVVRVICEFVEEAVAFSELRVMVRSPETKILWLLVTVFCPSEVMYVYSLPEKSLTGMVVLRVDRSEFVNSALLVVRDRDDDDDEESVAEAVVEAPVPVPVSSCARTASAARHSIHTGRDNMIAAVLDSLSVE